jgi:p-hydroxybenzoate 3-monooxygenase
MRIDTQIGIIGAGPAGLLLSQLLAKQGVESCVIESRTREYCETRVRAGVLECGTVELLKEADAAERLEREGLQHQGVYLRVRGRDHHINFPELTGGKTITVYAQQEVVKDLITVGLAAGRKIIFEAEDASLHKIEESEPYIRFTKDGESHEIHCRFIAGCDGFHGISRHSIPEGVLEIFDKTYPFAWLGILARVAPSSEELVYASHERGFALLSMRTPEISRLYLQCEPEEDVEKWPDDRIWSELRTRLARHDGWKLEEGPIFQKGVTGMRSFVVEPMQHASLFLAGDAAHIVPPTGAKGLNLAAADVRVLGEAFANFFRNGDGGLLSRYSEICLQRVWKAQRFSGWMTSLLHRLPNDSGFERRRQAAELDYLVSSRAAMQTLAENYVGLPFESLSAYLTT